MTSRLSLWFQANLLLANPAGTVDAREYAPFLPKSVGGENETARFCSDMATRRVPRLRVVGLGSAALHGCVPDRKGDPLFRSAMNPSPVTILSLSLFGIRFAGWSLRRSSKTEARARAPARPAPGPGDM